jgi:ACS family glucarate transporter-like MFS transporter
MPLNAMRVPEQCRTSQTEPAALPVGPTHARYWVVVFAVSLAMICYTDRVIIAKSETVMRYDLGLSNLQWTWVLAMFSLAYTFCEIPGGWLGDKFGPRVMLLRVVVLWSFFTAATGRTWNYSSLLVCWLMFGMGEAGCFPNLTKTFTAWLPLHERARAQGLMWMSARWGGAVTPFVVAWLLSFMRWRNVFTAFSLLGVVWAVFFYWWYLDNPREHPGVNEAEKALLPSTASHTTRDKGVPWGLILSKRSVWLLWLQYFLLSVPWWFYIQRLPRYMEEVRGFSLKSEQPLLGAAMAGLPLFLGGIGCWLGGHGARWLSDRLGGVAVTRRTLGVGGLLAAGGLILLSICLQNPYLAMLALGFAGFANDLTIAGSWSSCMDIGGRFAGSVSGGMNMGGAGGGAVAALLVGYILEWSGGNWNAALYSFVGLYVVAALCWLGIDPTTPLEQPENIARASTS